MCPGLTSLHQPWRPTPDFCTEAQASDDEYGDD
eukprot:CAMPEP_0197899942 /NCGR_PEP_ID=MMETSP1439-20131203/47799_1 /TAXON_ID=66791 /ORGANISM="Gonyaulax spinifera, Strain CCMP409" /LENGTH=32 /DNA_ID= /DNA_START= /DNA_END= /DNA_ORIENTATION=